VGPLHDIAATSQEARFRFAEALFYSGLADSALAEYKRVTEDTAGEFTGAAFDRMYLIEDASPKQLLPTLGRLMWLDWRGDARLALGLVDSLRHSIPPGPLWARLQIFRGQRLDAAGQPDSALVPLLELATQLPDDRLAPLARQLAGDVYQFRLKRDSDAIAQYEECLTRYPRAWNSAEVRRRLESLRKGRL
jgi:tetratricopeptide (TPR) repeat protein